MMASFISGVIGLMVTISILVLVRRDRLHATHGMSWIIVAVMFSLLGFMPILFDSLAEYIGIASPPLLALALAVAVIVIKLLLVDIERSRVELRYQRLVQRVAMLEAQIRTRNK